MKHPISKVAALVLTVALAASACGSSDETTDDTADATETSASAAAAIETVDPEELADEDAASAETAAPADDPAAADPGADAAAGSFAKTAQTDLGEIIVDANGMTLYAYTKDTGGLPTCTGGCLGAWPAVTVDGDALPAGLDSSVFSVVDGDGGKKQLKAGDWPLYYYAADAAAGDTTGQGSGDVWFVVSPSGELIK